jgi:hypothetical protein
MYTHIGFGTVVHLEKNYYICIYRDTGFKYRIEIVGSIFWLSISSIIFDLEKLLRCNAKNIVAFVAENLRILSCFHGDW